MSRDPDRLLRLRAQMGRDAILRVSEAARLLPMGDAAAREWLNRRGLVRTISDAHAGAKPPRVVIWGEVIMALNAESAQDWTPPVRPLIPRMKRKAFGT